jgi:hypothetical protein
MKLMWSCREVLQIKASGAYATAPLWIRLRIQVHYKLCRTCAAYVAALKKTASLFRQNATALIPPEAAHQATHRITQHLLNLPPKN